MDSADLTMATAYVRAPVSGTAALSMAIAVAPMITASAVTAIVVVSMTIQITEGPGADELCATKNVKAHRPARRKTELAVQTTIIGFVAIVPSGSVVPFMDIVSCLAHS